MMFIIRAGLQILADHPRLYLNAGSQAGHQWLRLRGPVPTDRRDCNDADAVWTAKEDSVTLPKHLGLPGFRHSIGLARWWYFSFDLLWLINGVVFYVLLFSTGGVEAPGAQLILTSSRTRCRRPCSICRWSCRRTPASSSYNALQLLAYFITVFIAAPVALVTGLLRRAPSIAGRFGTGARAC